MTEEATNYEKALAMGRRIKKLRTDQGLTQQQVADISGCSKGYVCTLERPTPDKEQRTSIDTVKRLASALNTTVDDLTSDDAPEVSFKDQATIKKFLGLEERDRSVISNMIAQMSQRSEAS